MSPVQVAEAYKETITSTFINRLREQKLVVNGVFRESEWHRRKLTTDVLITWANQALPESFSDIEFNDFTMDGHADFDAVEKGWDMLNTLFSNALQEMGAAVVNEVNLG